ncbi:MAG: hypothetical protein BHW64_04820 [Candidatus Melainabacteria bacterium LEY3_CP_29_8]|nr:MAG: hypothetical protein BHW64_04820 [Candidatus Melainabacteria bacterium LEY3_CP_29_8]
MKNILLINFGGLGDEILFLPTINTLKKLYPTSKITLVLEPRGKSIQNLSSLIDKIKIFDVKGKNKFIELFKLLLFMRFNSFDIVISSGSNKLIPILLFLSGIKKRYGYDSGKLSQCLYTKAIKLNKNQYAANMYHDLLDDLTIIDKVALPKIDVNINNTSIHPNSVLIHPGVSKISVKKGIVKTFGDKKWIELIQKLLSMGKVVYLAGGPDDDEIIKQILSQIPNDTPNFINMYGKTKNIVDLAQLISNCEVIICSDSAPMHIAVAQNKKTIAIFGPTDENKLMPKDNWKFIPITAKNAPCRPCLWDKRTTTCECLDCLNINIDEIISKL